MDIELQQEICNFDILSLKELPRLRKRTPPERYVALPLEILLMQIKDYLQSWSQSTDDRVVRLKLNILKRKFAVFEQEYIVMQEAGVRQQKALLLEFEKIANK